MRKKTSLKRNNFHKGESGEERSEVNFNQNQGNMMGKKKKKGERQTKKIVEREEKMAE